MFVQGHHSLEEPQRLTRVETGTQLESIISCVPVSSPGGGYWCRFFFQQKRTDTNNPGHLRRHRRRLLRYHHHDRLHRARPCSDVGSGQSVSSLAAGRTTRHFDPECRLIIAAADGFAMAALQGRALVLLRSQKLDPCSPPGGAYRGPSGTCLEDDEPPLPRPPVRAVSAPAAIADHLHGSSPQSVELTQGNVPYLVR